ncbi:MAG: hypothetical protein Q4B80_04585 [Aerococcaceae bacterium]|nr:hypothetical protein [Aerococcaceae bacterium]
MTTFNIQPMLNVYPDSLAGNLAGTIHFLSQDVVKNSFQAVYILPSLFHTDLDRGFSVIDYNLNETFVKPSDLAALEQLGVKTKLDFILNHASVLSPQFQSIIQEGSQSPYYDFFIDWNTFWQNHGEMTESGYIQPQADVIQEMFFRKPGLPILTVTTENDERLTFWNTFYQEKVYPNVTAQTWMKVLNCQYGQALAIRDKVEAHLAENTSLEGLDLAELSPFSAKVTHYLEKNCEYLGQMDLNIQSPLVWEFYAQTLDKLQAYGASIVRLDAFAYAPKQVGSRNFLNDPGTWELLDKVSQLAKERNLTLLPEIHESYEAKIHERIANEGYLTYDFFLPGLVLDTIEGQDATHLVAWIRDILDKKLCTVNMLGCHDGIPLLDLKGLLPEQRIQELIETVVNRGGYVKNLHGQQNVYYQVNATYYSALGENDTKMLLARALQLFVPGKPQIWYLDIFAGKNDHEAVERAGAGGHKEINRTNLTQAQIDERLAQKVVQDQLALIRFRHESKAFHADAIIDVIYEGTQLTIKWQHEGHQAQLCVDLMQPQSLEVTGTTSQNEVHFVYRGA